MFKVTGDFSQGAFYDHKANGFQAMVMQRQQDIDDVIKDFERAIAAGYNPNEVKDIILQNHGITRLTAAETERITRAVENIYRSKKGYN